MSPKLLENLKGFLENLKGVGSTSPKPESKWKKAENISPTDQSTLTSGKEESSSGRDISILKEEIEKLKNDTLNSKKDIDRIEANENFQRTIYSLITTIVLTGVVLPIFLWTNMRIEEVKNDLEKLKILVKKIFILPLHPNQLHIRQSSTNHPSYHTKHHIHGIQSSNVVPTTKLIDIAVQMLVADYVEDSLIATF